MIKPKRELSKWLLYNFMYLMPLLQLLWQSCKNYYFLQLKLVFEINLRNLQGVIHDKNNYFIICFLFSFVNYQLCCQINILYLSPSDVINYYQMILFSVRLVPKSASDFYKPSFLGSVYESHVVMAQVWCCNWHSIIMLYQKVHQTFGITLLG